MINGDFLFYTLAISTIGFIGNSYRFFAQSQGWPTGTVFARDGSWPQATVILVPIGVGIAWYDFGFFYGVGVFLGGFFLAFVLSMLLRQHVQPLWLLAIVSVVAYAVLRNIF